jgi:hypothetical protein
MCSVFNRSGRSWPSASADHPVRRRGWLDQRVEGEGMNPTPTRSRATSKPPCASYTGAKYAVTTTSCTMAIQIAAPSVVPQLHDGGCRIFGRSRGATCPRCPMSACRQRCATLAEAHRLHDEDWRGEYEIFPLGRVGLARRFTSGMFRPGAMQCVSFHWGKILGLSQGGAILHDNDEADAWLRRARFDGRTEGVDPKHDQVQYPSWHAYLSPEVAAHGLMKLSLLPAHNDDLPNSDYPDLSNWRPSNDRRTTDHRPRHRRSPRAATAPPSGKTAAASTKAWSSCTSSAPPSSPCSIRWARWLTARRCWRSRPWQDPQAAQLVVNAAMFLIDTCTSSAASSSLRAAR